MDQQLIILFVKRNSLSTRMITFIKPKFKKSNDQTNIDKYRVYKYYGYHTISKLIFLRLIIPKFMWKRQLFHLKMYVKMSKSTCLNGRMDFVVRIIEFLRLLHCT